MRLVFKVSAAAAEFFKGCSVRKTMPKKSDKTIQLKKFLA